MRKKCNVLFTETTGKNPSEGAGEIVIGQSFISLYLPAAVWGDNYVVKAFGNGTFQGQEANDPTVSMQVATLDANTYVGLWFEEKLRYFILIEVDE